MQPTLCVGDGHSYEQAAIVRWLQTHSTSPVTGQQLAMADLLPSHALRQMIQAAGRIAARSSCSWQAAALGAAAQGPCCRGGCGDLAGPAHWALTV